ncbi:spore cortex biosynthesis protein YabQ [Salibacterium halotolerans]|uniref:Spore cortex biosynthesis protein YabQ n=1 Tax=Salibacterium halotolerans TaxID=1884432 RepID=A0A1I5WM15_9BACI|nr:spore cortex biosynthesis protein YabQ [Salibacterium halotolerans]SFQ20426.1 spore cortex biosynthesis protein YabQ [Salibacterium halotolerans]
MTLAVQFQTMAAMLVMGMGAGVCLDVYERLFVRIIRSSWIRAGGDMMFWFLQALLVFYVLFQMNSGELRFYIFPGLAVGFFVYRYLGRASFLRILEFFCRMGYGMYRIFRAVVTVLVLHPLKFILQLAAASVMMGLTIIKNFLFLCLRILLLPLKGLVHVGRPAAKRVLPAPVLAFLKKTTDIMMNRRKDE